MFFFLAFVMPLCASVICVLCSPVGKGLTSWLLVLSSPLLMSLADGLIPFLLHIESYIWYMRKKIQLDFAINYVCNWFICCCQYLDATPKMI